MKLPESVELGLIDTSGGSDTVIMVKKVLEWSGKGFEKEEWTRIYTICNRIKECILEENDEGIRE